MCVGEDPSGARIGVGDAHYRVRRALLPHHRRVENVMRHVAKRGTKRPSDIETLLDAAFEAVPEPVPSATRPLSNKKRANQKKKQHTSAAQATGELSKTDSGGIGLEDRIHVLEERVTNDPGWNTLSTPC